MAGIKTEDNTGGGLAILAERRENNRRWQREYYHKRKNIPSVVAARKRHPSRSKERRAESYRRNLDKVRDSKLKRKYNITLAQRNELLSAQGNACAGCGRERPNGRGDWHVDHNHKTGLVRGILCSSCNFILGHAYDSSSILRRLADYIDHNKETKPQ